MKVLTRLFFLQAFFLFTFIVSCPAKAATDGTYSLEGGFSPTVNQSTDGVYNLTASNSIFANYGDDGSYILYPGISSAVLASVAGSSVNGGTHLIILPAVVPSIDVGGSNYVYGDIDDPSNPMQLEGSVLSLNFTDVEVDYIAVSFDGGFEKVSWEVLGENKLIDFGSKTGQQVVYLKFMNKSGAVSDVKELYVYLSADNNEVIEVPSIGGYEGKLIKYADSPKVFYIENNLKRHIANEEAFVSNGFDWNAIIVVPSTVVFFEGNSIFAKIETKAVVVEDNRGYLFTEFLSIGSEGEEVRQLQAKLRSLGFFNYESDTAYYGSVTEAAVKAFQRANGIDPVGYVGPGTRAVLNAGIETNLVVEDNTNQYIFKEFLSLGSEDEEVRQLQVKLRSLGFFNYESDTGYYGSVTELAVKEFQIANGIDPVGYVGPGTRAALNN